MVSNTSNAWFPSVWYNSVFSVLAIIMSCSPLSSLLFLRHRTHTHLSQLIYSSLSPSRMNVLCWMSCCTFRFCVHGIYRLRCRLAVSMPANIGLHYSLCSPLPCQLGPCLLCSPHTALCLECQPAAFFPSQKVSPFPYVKYLVFHEPSSQISMYHVPFFPHFVLLFSIPWWAPLASWILQGCCPEAGPRSQLVSCNAPTTTATSYI